MTYLKTALIATALTTATSTAAFADGHKSHDAKTMDKSMVSATAPMTDVRGVTKANDTIGEVLQADGQPDMQTDNELLTHDGDMLTKTEAKMMDSDNLIANNTIVVPSSSGAITTVSCPIGTTAQPDMTCMVTGNYDLEKSESSRKLENAADAKVMGATYQSKQVDWDKKAKWDANPETSADALSTMRPEYSLEYKGTLRPDTAVKPNIN